MLGSPENSKGELLGTAEAGYFYRPDAPLVAQPMVG